MNKSTLDEFMKAKGMPEIDLQFYAQRQSDFILRDNLPFLNITLANSLETILVFVVLGYGPVDTKSKKDAVKKDRTC